MMKHHWTNKNETLNVVRLYEKHSTTIETY